MWPAAALYESFRPRLVIAIDPAVRGRSRKIFSRRGVRRDAKLVCLHHVLERSERAETGGSAKNPRGRVEERQSRLHEIYRTLYLRIRHESCIQDVELEIEEVPGLERRCRQIFRIVVELVFDDCCFIHGRSCRAVGRNQIGKIGAFLLGDSRRLSIAFAIRTWNSPLQARTGSHQNERHHRRSYLHS